MRNLILIGMPGSGKSTIGRALALRWQWPLVDTDDLLVARFGRPLQRVVDTCGYRTLRELECEILSELNLSQHIISTGGSAIYHAAAMRHLEKIGTRVYLQISLAELLRRVTNASQRGLASAPGQTLEDLYSERAELYEKYADVMVSAQGRSVDECCRAVEWAVAQRWGACD